MLAAEFDGETPTAEWHSRPDDTDVAFIRWSNAPPAALSSAGITQRLVAAFLPTGYPASVTPDYLTFNVWDSTQAICSYVRGMLTSQAILVGIGVGRQVR